MAPQTQLTPSVCVERRVQLRLPWVLVWVVATWAGGSQVLIAAREYSHERICVI